MDETIRVYDCGCRESEPHIELSRTLSGQDIEFCPKAAFLRKRIEAAREVTNHTSSRTQEIARDPCACDDPDYFARPRPIFDYVHKLRQAAIESERLCEAGRKALIREKRAGAAMLQHLSGQKRRGAYLDEAAQALPDAAMPSIEITPRL